MATALFPLRRVQYGVESTAGEPLAATTLLAGETAYAPAVARWRPAWRLGARAASEGLVDQQRASLLLCEAELDYEQMMLFLETGLARAETTGSGPYTHTYRPHLAGAPDVGSATFEYIVEDGSSEHFERAFSYGTTQRLTVELARDQRARLAAEVFGRAEQPASAASGLAAPARTAIESSDFALYIDDAWMDLGATQKALPVEFATLDLFPGLAPDFTLDGRADLDFTGLRWSRLRGLLRLTVEHNADAAAEVAAWRTGTRRALRLEATSGSKLLRFDMSGFYATDPRIARERDRELVTLALTLDYDPVATRLLEVTAVNDIPGL